MSQASIEKQPRIRLVSPHQDPHLWDTYVARHPKGSVFHTSKMHSVFESTPMNSPWSMAAVCEETGNIVALACAVRIETMSGIASNISSRSIWYAEPLCEDTPTGKAGLAELIHEHDRTMRGRVVFTEVRANFEPKCEREVLTGNGYTFLDYLNYVVDLQQNCDQLQQNLSKSCRKQIRKCNKAGVQIEVVQGHDAIDQMYKLVQFSYERSKVPLASVQLFHHALDAFGDEVVKVRLARLDSEVVSAGIVLQSHGVMYAWYGGSLRVTGLAPFAALTWHEIETGSRDGLQLYDFGGAGWPDEEYGPREFKAKFGGRLVHHGRYRRINSKFKLRAAKTAYETSRFFKSLISSK